MKKETCRAAWKAIGGQGANIQSYSEPGHVSDGLVAAVEYASPEIGPAGLGFELETDDVGGTAVELVETE